ncbi:hypothetical protein ABPG72_019540 [Tetrahymena utriculariae]
MQEQSEKELPFQGEKLIQQDEQKKASKEQQKDILQSEQPSYKQKEYWNERYKFKQTYYDWYCGYEELKPIFEQCYNISKNAKILMIGCGNSKLSEDMFDDGYINIVSTDISDIVIEQMKESTQKKNKNMTFEVQDCTNLTYQDQTFDFVFDKGTLDALSCDKEEESVSKMLKEMMRVCKPQGSVVIVSFGQLHERKMVFQESLGFKQYSYELCQKYLSIDSQLTNIMRHVSNGLPINLVLKNKTLLLQTLIELRSVKSLLKNEVIQSLAIDWEQVTQIENIHEFQIQDEQKLKDEKDCFQNVENTSIEIQQDTNNKNGISNSDQNNQLANNPENQIKQDCSLKEHQTEISNKKQEGIDQKLAHQQDEEEEEEEKVDNLPQQQNQQIQEEKNKSESSISDQEEDHDSEEDKQKKPKFRRQTQCFIYRITHKS